MMEKHGHPALGCRMHMQNGYAPFFFLCSFLCLCSCSRDMYKQHGHAAKRPGHKAGECNMNMQHRHAAWRHGHGAWKHSIGMQNWHAKWTCCMDKQHGYTFNFYKFFFIFMFVFMLMFMQHVHVACSCSMDLQRCHAA